MPEPLGSGYVLEDEVGRGAIGGVWKGYRRADGHPLAFKLLRPELLNDFTVVRRFLAERSILLGIEDHPNLVKIQDLVVEGQSFAIVMELIRGGVLRAELLDRLTLPVGEALSVLAGVMAGVGHLHRAGVIHGDLKPENILLDTTGREIVPKVTDYGTARLVAAGSTGDSNGLWTTPEYVAPELADHGELSPATDVYAAGVMLYEMVGGATPFASGTPVAVLRRHIHSKPSQPPQVNEDVWGLLSAMLSKDAERRPSAESAAAMCQELALTEARSTLSRTRVSPGYTETVLVKPLRTVPAVRETRQPQGRSWLVGILAGVLLLGGGVVAASRIDREPNVKTQAAATPSPSELSPSPTPSRTEVRPTPSLIPRVDPKEPSDGPSMSPEEVRQLLEHVPAALRNSCRYRPSVNADLNEGLLARVSCYPKYGPTTVRYYRYKNKKTMTKAFHFWHDETDFSDCTTSSPGITSYTRPGDKTGALEKAGELACLRRKGNLAFVWTNERLRIVSIAERRKIKSAEMYQFWLSDAGPF